MKNDHESSPEMQKNLRVAFEEVGNNLRYFLDDRFKIFALASAFSGAALAVLSWRQVGLPEVAISLSMFFVALLCWIMDRSSRAYYEKYLEEALKIQENLNIRVFSVDSRPPYKRSTPWVNFFYVALLLVWGTIFILTLISWT